MLVYVGKGAHECQSEVTLRYLFLIPFNLCLSAMVSLREPETQDFTRLAGQWASGLHLFLLPYCWAAGVCCHLQLLCTGPLLVQSVVY